MADEAAPLDRALNWVADHTRRSVESDGTDRLAATARTASAEEQRRWWPQLVAIVPAYDEHQANTERDIPVAILRRR